MQSTTRLLSNDDEQKSNPSVPNMPPHWVFEREGCTSPHTHFCWWPPFHFFHHLICVISWGHGSLVPVWEVSYPGCPPKDWKDERELVGGRLGQVNIVTGLLVSATVALSTTTPPDPSLLPYTNPVPYCFLWVSVAFSLSGLLIGSIGAFIVSQCTAKWFRDVRYPFVLGCSGDRQSTVYYRLSSTVFHIEESDRRATQVMMGSRFRVWITMCMLSAPLASLAVATSSVGIGLIIAATYSNFKVVQIGCYFVIAPPLVCGVSFALMTFVSTDYWGRRLLKF